MKWMLYVLIVLVAIAHYHQLYLDWKQRNDENSIRFTVEMSRQHPTFVHPLEEK